MSSAFRAYAKCVLRKIFLAFFLCLCVFAGCFQTKAQSTNQDFPTPVTRNEISGKIPARDIGDARLTSYFYAFEGTQGDVFINVEATNLNGDIDVFTVGNLRPLTKISLYAGDSTTETGRVIYLRKSEKLVLRVEGRTPNDNPAIFRIKFAGSFVAMQSSDTETEPKLPEVRPDDQKSGVRVNSVGTIIEVRPKPTPQPKTETIAEKNNSSEIKKTQPETTEETPTAKVVVTNETPKPEEEARENSPQNKKPAAPRNAGRRNTATPKRTVKTPPETNETTAVTTPKKNTVKNVPKKTPVEKPKETPIDPLASVRLIVVLKDGTSIERPMNEISRVNVDRGILTIVAKDGSIKRYPILEVAKMTIE